MFRRSSPADIRQRMMIVLPALNGHRSLLAAQFCLQQQLRSIAGLQINIGLDRIFSL